jgi:NTP pyrophosphatase (non-canonical NTP hydrolase)
MSKPLHDHTPIDWENPELLEHLIRLGNGVNTLAHTCYSAAAQAGWWTDPETGEALDRNKPEMMMLMVSEVAEMMEGVRKSLPDDHLPHRSMEEVEAADLLIRLMDYCGAYGLDIGGALIEKLQYNAQRADHKLENRTKDGGKAF